MKQSPLLWTPTTPILYPCSSDSTVYVSYCLGDLGMQLPPGAGWSMTVSWLCLGERDWWLRRTTACSRRRPALLTRTCRRGAGGRKGEITWLYTHIHFISSHVHTVPDWVSWITHSKACCIRTYHSVLWYTGYRVWDHIGLCTYVRTYVVSDCYAYYDICYWLSTLIHSPQPYT